MVQRLIHKTMLKIVNSLPDSNFLYKLLKGDTLELCLKIKSDEKPQDIIAEAWTNIAEKQDTFFSARKLKFFVKENGVLIFKAKIVINETGFFKVLFRARKKTDSVWQWLEKNSVPTELEIQSDPLWLKDAIVYNAFIRFFGAKKLHNSGLIKPGEGGTFDDLIKKLKHLKNMGVNVLYLNPIHIIGELYRNYNPHDLLPAYLQQGSPYSIKDYKSIDPELAYSRHQEIESLSDPFIEFKELVDQAHKLGIRVIMDMVFNHTSHDFVLQKMHPEWFLYKTNIKSLDEPYIYPQELAQGKPWGDAKYTFCPNDHGFWWEDAAQLNWEYKIPFAKNPAPPNPTIKLMWEYFKSITKYWVQKIGIDGFRCDVAYRIPPQFWKECISETRKLAKQCTPKNCAIDKDVVFIAESYCDDLFELQSAGFSAVYGDYSNKLYTPQTLKGYLDYIYNQSGNFFPTNSKWLIFPECHDFHRSTKKYAEKYSSHELADLRANKSRWILSATLPGIPMIFNGFEKLEWLPVNLFSYSAINWEGDKDLSKFIKKVNLLRRKYKSLQEGKYIFVPSNQGLTPTTQIFSFVRILKDEKILIVVNMDIVKKVDCATIYLPDELKLDFSKKYWLSDVLNNKKYERKGKEIHIVLEPGESHIFLVKQQVFK